MPESGVVIEPDAARHETGDPPKATLQPDSTQVVRAKVAVAIDEEISVKTFRPSRADQTLQGLAVVTGASSGIGAEYARQLAAQGYDLLLIARRWDRLRVLADELRSSHGIQAEVLAVDLNDLLAAERVRAEVERIGRPLKWLINNAGYGMLGPFEGFTIEDQRRFVRVLGLAPIELTHALLPQLRRAVPSHVINVASLAAYLPGTAGSGLYHGVKSMLFKFTEMLAAELAEAKITVTASCPGMTESEIFDHHGPDVDVSYFKKLKVMPASTVVREALAAAKASRVSVIHGGGNRLVAWLARHLPPSVMRYLVWRQSMAFIKPNTTASTA